MPHGGGHHGGGGGHHGGGFGGGHHHRGGWGGHRRHHHHGGHHHHHGWGWGRHHHAGYYGHWHYYGRRPGTWVVFSIVLVLVIIISVTVSVRYTASDYTKDDGLHYAATDTRVIPVSSTLCQGLKLTVDDSLSGYTASLSLLDSHPQLSGHETFAVSNDKYLGKNEYDYYYFYMYPGSSFTVSACISKGYSAYATFNMIKGNGRFKNWVNEPYHVDNNFQVNTLCSIGNNTHTYHVKHEDYYYLIFDADYGRYTQLTRNMAFHRTRYDVNVSAADTCITKTGIQGDSCSLSMPLSGKTAFLEVTPLPGTDIDWEEGVGLKTTCVPRIWIYVVIALSILVGLVAILAPLLVFIVIRLRKKNQASSAVTTTTSDAAVETDTTSLITTPPPPSNPDFQEPPPSYGINYEAPPAYKV